MKLFLRVGSVLVMLVFAFETWAENENDCCDFEIAEFVENSTDLVHKRFDADQLEVLHSKLPHVHTLVASPEWNLRNGPEKLRIAAEVILEAWGSDQSETQDMLDRVQKYEIDIPTPARMLVEFNIGLIAESMIEAYINIDQEEKLTESVVDSFSFAETTHPDEYLELRECFNGAIEKRGKIAMLLFENWTKALQSSDRIEIAADSGGDAIIELSGNLQLDLYEDLSDAQRDYQLCLKEFDFS